MKMNRIVNFLIYLFEITLLSIASLITVIIVFGYIVPYLYFAIYLFFSGDSSIAHC